MTEEGERLEYPLSPSNEMEQVLVVLVSYHEKEASLNHFYLPVVLPPSGPSGKATLTFAPLAKLLTKSKPVVSAHSEPADFQAACVVEDVVTITPYCTMTSRHFNSFWT